MRAPSPLASTDLTGSALRARCCSCLLFLVTPFPALAKCYVSHTPSWKSSSCRWASGGQRAFVGPKEFAGPSGLSAELLSAWLGAGCVSKLYPCSSPSLHLPFLSLSFTVDTCSVFVWLPHLVKPSFVHLAFSRPKAYESGCVFLLLSLSPVPFQLSCMAVDPGMAWKANCLP